MHDQGAESSRKGFRKHAEANGWRQRSPRSPLFRGDSFEKGDLWLDVNFSTSGTITFGWLQEYGMVKQKGRIGTAYRTLAHVNHDNTDKTATVRDWIEGKIPR